jgi:hypothetical protein
VERFASFLWTLPVPWAGFTQLPADPGEAAALSRTIRWQRELIRRWAADDGGEIVHEEVFLELSPDRGSAVMEPALDRLLRRAGKLGARPVLVRYREVAGWRSHHVLEEWIDAHAAAVVALDPLPLGGEDPFDPVAHFRAWGARQAAWSGSKEARRAAIAHAVGELGGKGVTDAELAARLNARSVTTVGGKAWTAENMRKARGRLSRQEAVELDEGGSGGGT